MICSRRLIKNNAARRAERGPSPGSFASSWISVSSSDIGGKQPVSPEFYSACFAVAGRRLPRDPEPEAEPDAASRERAARGWGSD